MNSDDVRTFNRIKQTGWYQMSATMGEGGWAKVHELATFNTYVALGEDGEELETIRAIDDNTAREAFASLYRPPFTIFEKTVIFRELD